MTELPITYNSLSCKVRTVMIVASHNAKAHGPSIGTPTLKWQMANPQVNTHMGS